jgi:CcmD family protein
MMASFLTILLQGPIADPMQFNNYLVLGYVVMWLIGTGYVVSLAVRQRNLQKDVAMLKRLLQEDEEAGS